MTSRTGLGHPRDVEPVPRSLGVRVKVDPGGGGGGELGRGGLGPAELRYQPVRLRQPVSYLLIFF